MDSRQHLQLRAAACSAVLCALFHTEGARAQASNAHYCREVAATTPPNYDPAIEGCFAGTQAVGCPASASGTAPPLFWRNECVSFSMHAASSISPPSSRVSVSLAEATQIATAAFGAWTNVTCPNGFPPSIQVFTFPSVTCDQVPSREHNNPIIFRDDAWPYTDTSNAVGYTTLTVDLCSGEILGAAIEINSADHMIVPSAPAPAGAYDLPTILTHEAGHFLGLAHSGDPNAVMYAFYHARSASLDGGASLITPDDVAGLCSIYDPDGHRNTQAGPASAMTCNGGQPPLQFQQVCGSGSPSTVSVGSGNPETKDGGSTGTGEGGAWDGGDCGCSDTLFSCAVGRPPHVDPHPSGIFTSGWREALPGCAVTGLLGFGLMARRRTKRRGRSSSKALRGLTTSGGPRAAAACIAASLLGCGSVDQVAASLSDAAPGDDSGKRYDAHIVQGDGSDTATGDANGAMGEAASATTGDANGALGDGGVGNQPPAPPASTTALLRVANWSPDSPAVDVCIALHGSEAFQGPLATLLASRSANSSSLSVDQSSLADAGVVSLPFPLVTAYLTVQPGQYDARVVVAGAGTCAAGVGPDATSLLDLKAGDAETVALLGEVQPSGGDFRMSIAGFADDVSPRGNLLLRFINAAPSLALASLGTGSIATNDFVPIFQSVAYGWAGTAGESSIPLGVDPRGYVGLAPLSSVTLSAHAPGVASDAVATTSFWGPAGAVLSVVLLGPTRSSPTARLLECADNAGSAGWASDCQLLP